MTHVYIIVEGQTEETFVKEVLYPHLFPMGVWPSPLLTGTRKTRRADKGGHRGVYGCIREDIVCTLKQHAPRGAHVTTMLDLYALPTDFPGFAGAGRVRDPYRRVEGIEQAIEGDIDDHRFFAYIQLHEFEALLLSDTQAIVRSYPTALAGVASLTQEIAAFRGPEWVNDDPVTAPSKRLRAHIPEYDKTLAGSLIVMDIGLDVVRAKCQHFAAWLTKLECLHTLAQ